VDLRLIEKVRRVQRTQAALERSRFTEPEIITAPTLLDFVPRLSPQFSSPRHLAPLASALERAPHGRLRIVVSVPPRGGKTELVMHAVARWLSSDPALAVMYLTYGAKLAYSKSRRMRKLAMRAGVRLAPDARGKGEWLTADEGGMRAAGIDGDVIGHGAGVLIFDDPHKNRAEAESPVLRDHVWDQFKSAAETRLEPDGSVVLVQQRWNDDDCAARAIAEGYEYICLPALVGDGDDERSYWPERWSVADLRRIRASKSDYEWWSLYQGDPRPRDGRVFGDAVTCTLADLPRIGRRATGVDLTHSSKTRTDYHASVTLLEKDGVFWVVDVRRQRGTLTDERRTGPGHPPRAGFVRELQHVRTLHGSRFAMYTGRDEDLVLSLLATMGSEGIPIEARRAQADKWVRAQPVAAAWKAGRIRVPVDAPWADDFIAELVSFPGGANDDQVDAFACAFDMLSQGTGLDVLTSSRSDREAEAHAAARARLRKGRYYT